MTVSTTFVPPANFLTDLIDEHIEALEEPRVPDGLWHPSSYWGCTRKVIYEVRGTPQTNPPDKVSKRRFRIGHMFHEFVQDALATAPEFVEFYPEFAIESKLQEAGHGDGLVHYVAGDQDFWFVLEAKSARAAAFKFGLKEDHAKQASSYAVAARTQGVYVDDDTATLAPLDMAGNPIGPQGQRLDDPAAGGFATDRFIPPLGEKMAGVLVLYLEKTDLDTREFWLPYDLEWETRLQERLAHLETYRADPESLPPRLPMVKGKKNWMCGYCPFMDKCWQVDKGGVEPTGATDVPAVYEW